MRLRRPLPAVQGDTLHIVGVGDNRIGKIYSTIFVIEYSSAQSLSSLRTKLLIPSAKFVAMNYCSIFTLSIISPYMKLRLRTPGQFSALDLR